jgi:hypothetical protein
MTGVSDQTLAARKQATTQAQLQSNLSAIALPGLKSMIGPGGTLSNLLASTNNGQNLSSLDQKAMDTVLGQVKTGYGQAGFGTKEAISYGGLRSGEGRLSGTGGPQSSALSSAAMMLDRDRFMAEQNIKYASDAAGMTNFNKILNLFGQGTQTALGLGAGNANAATSAIAGMSTNTQTGSILGGASAGAAAGSAILPGWGTVIGAVGGGLVGGLAGG